MLCQQKFDESAVRVRARVCVRVRVRVRVRIRVTNMLCQQKI